MGYNLAHHELRPFPGQGRQTRFKELFRRFLRSLWRLILKIYFAGPLFCEAERDWIRSTINKIESFAAQNGTKAEIVFPYDLITQSEIDHLGSKAKLEIFSRCKSHLDDAGLVIALLDGSQVATKSLLYLRPKPANTLWEGSSCGTNGILHSKKAQSSPLKRLYPKRGIAGNQEVNNIHPSSGQLSCFIQPEEDGVTFSNSLRITFLTGLVPSSERLIPIFEMSYAFWTIVIFTAR